LARTAVLVALAGLLVSVSWLRVERGPVPFEELAEVLALALLPIVAAAPGSRRLVVLGLATIAALVALGRVFGVPVTNARPRSGHDFFGPVLGSFKDGTLGFFDTELPFARGELPLMHAVVLLAIFGFSAGAGSLLAARRPVAAVLVLAVAIAWPATIVPGPRPLVIGALGLSALLAILFLVREGARPVRGVLHGAAVALVLVAAALVASTSDAVAKGAFLGWQSWDPYDRPEPPVGVRYVWGSHYRGIAFPEKETVVLRVRTPSGKRSLYWRATTLDDYTGSGWVESLDLSPPEEADEIDAAGRDPLSPRRARNEDNWVRQDVTVEALRDNHLSGAAQPMRWRPPEDSAVRLSRGETAVLPRSLRQDQRYTVWSYVPQARPSQLAKAGTDYPEQIERHLEVVQTIDVPPFGVSGREALMAVFFDQFADDYLMSVHRPLYEQAVQVVGEARTPYAAAVALEAWFRTQGGFAYDEQPPPPAGIEPALVAFLDHRQGYCQHYAGAMALMLRFLGIPARVAAGFTSGTYDEVKREWTVTDHQAHTWVEVYFPGWGWLPFDPTPGRGQLGGAYSPYSSSFNIGDAIRDRDTLGGSATLEALRRQLEGRPGLENPGGLANPGRGGGATTVVRENAPSLLALVALVLGAAFLAVASLKIVRRRMRFASRDPRALAAACRRDLVGFLADQGIDLPESATLADLGRVLEHDYAIETLAFVRTATVARFGPPGEAESAVRRARRELRRIQRQLSGQLGFVSRVRGLVSLRSLAV
jgi:protein-glutamine gamma-glutamyltransferase